MYYDYNMTKKIIIIFVLIIVLLGIIYFSNVFINKKDSDAQFEQVNNSEKIIRTLDIKHQYQDGIHIFVGNLELPTSCHSFNVFIEEGEVEEKNLIIETVAPEKEEFCAQAISNKTYRAVYEGDEDLVFRAFVNGEEFGLNIFEMK